MNDAVMLSESDLAERWGIALSTVNTWIQTGDAPRHLTLSKKIRRFRLEDVEAFERARETDPDAAD